MSKDTYGIALDTASPEWKSFQARNADIEKAAVSLRAKSSSSYQLVYFFSEGTRCAGSIWRPQTPLPGNPALLLCHGWGGTRAFLDVRYASKFAEEGFVVMTFDYRGWGDSDGVLVSQHSQDLQALARRADFSNQMPVSGQATVRVIRQTVDMNWQLADIDAAISFFCTLPNVGALGLWGTSQGGGHVLAQTSIEEGALKRIQAVVAQVPSVGRNGAGSVENRLEELRQHSTRACQEGWFPAGGREYHLPTMDGSPILKTLIAYDPLLTMGRISRASLLVIDASKEELWDVNKNGLRAFQLATTPKKEYYVLNNADHYDAYNKSAREARSVASDFFKRHLSKL